METVMKEQGSGQNIDFQQTLLLSTKQYDDRVFLKTGFTDKEVRRAIHKHGIYNQRLAQHNREKSLGGENIQELFAKREAMKKA